MMPIRTSPRLTRAAILVTWITLLAGCGQIIPLAAPVKSLYNLTPKSTFRPGLPEVPWQLVIEQPVAAGGLDTDRIALRPSPTELKYFVQARWTERAPKMIQTLLVESFENTEKIVAVGRQAIGLRSDFNLKTELREFYAEYFIKEHTPQIHVRLNAKIISQPRQNIIASKSFESRKTAGGETMQAVITSFDQALGKVLKELVEWSLLKMNEEMRETKRDTP